MRYILDGNRMTDRESAHDELARALGFPEWYGRNLDALWDLVSVMEGEIMLLHPERLTELGLYGGKLLDTLREAAGSGRLTLSFGEKEDL